MSDRLAEAKAAIAQHRAQSVHDGADFPSLFDAEQERDTAIAAIADTYRGQLLDELDEHLERLAHQRQTLTVDDLRDVLPTHLTNGLDLKVLGSTLTRAARRKVIRAAGYAPSRRRHAAPVRVWESQVCDGE
jgi:hypothetical protein